MLSLRYFSFLVLFLLLSGCSGNQTLESLFAPDTSLTITEDRDETQNNNDNQQTLPDNFPDTIPLYSEAELIKIEENSFFWSSGDPSNLIMDYYLQELTSKQWQVEQTQENLLTAINDDESLELEVSVLPSGNQTEFTLSYQSLGENTNLVQGPNNNDNTVTVINQPARNGDISQPLQTLIDKGIIDKNVNSLKSHQEVTRREYVRWLVKTNNLLYENVDGSLIRVANPNSNPVFEDVDKDDPDFPYIQGLAEAGLIPSVLTNTNSSTATTFNPDASLTREDLISWKVPLDFRQNFSVTTIDNIKETWGFQDTNKIKPEVWQKLYIDWQNGENANIRRAFGFTTIFQPQKPVTKEEVAIVLNRFGYQGSVRSLNELE